MSIRVFRRLCMPVYTSERNNAYYCLNGIKRTMAACIWTYIYVPDDAKQWGQLWAWLTVQGSVFLEQKKLIEREREIEKSRNLEQTQIHVRTCTQMSNMCGCATYTYEFEKDALEESNHVFSFCCTWSCVSVVLVTSTYYTRIQEEKKNRRNIRRGALSDARTCAFVEQFSRRRRPRQVMEEEAWR